MPKKNVALVITRLDLGGAQKVVLYLAENLDREKYNVHLIAGPGGMLDNEAASIKGIRTLFMKELKHPVSPVNDIKAAGKLEKYFKDNNIETVHTHSSKAGFIGRMAASSAKVNNIIHTVHGFSFHEYQNPAVHSLYIALERFAAGKTSILAAVGEDVASYGIKNGVGKKTQYRIVRAGIDIEEYSGAEENRKSLLSEAGLSPEFFTVGMIGNLKRQKNPAEFVKIAAKALESSPDMQFVFAGGGTEKQEKMIKKLIARCKLEEKVKFTGWTERPGMFMKSIDVFLLTSLWEGLPCTLVQAAAAGKPFIATDIPGNREFSDYLETGLLYRPGDIAGAAEKINVLKGKNGEAERLSEKAEERLREFSLVSMLKKYTEIY